ncbi:polysaccharide biosynthesis protein [bacterium]|nr:polysaccharide biosynthesis protein [bacterium]
MFDLFEGKKILVTGGTGSIGSEIVRNLMRYNPSEVRVFSRGESEIFDMQHSFSLFENITYLVGDVRDKSRLAKSIKGVDYVFHTAALKHVPTCELNPYEAVKTNVIGTENLIDLAVEEGVGRVISISTDKACSPTNVMGATKLLAERIIAAANCAHGNTNTVFASVRFGNVMASRGSVIPLFVKQIQQGGPVTLTSREMTRFMMTIPQAINLIFEATRIARGGEIFILKMPALCLVDLAEVMIEEIAPSFGFEPEDIALSLIGPRPGEKMYEQLLTYEESKLVAEYDNMFVLTSRLQNSAKANERFSSNAISYSSNQIPLLTKNEIRALLRTIHVIPDNVQGIKREFIADSPRSRVKHILQHQKHV